MCGIDLLFRFEQIQLKKRLHCGLQRNNDLFSARRILVAAFKGGFKSDHLLSQTIPNFLPGGKLSWVNKAPQ